MTAPIAARPRSYRRMLVCFLGLAVLGTCVGLGFRYAGKRARFDPPKFEAAGVDPAVVRSLEEKSETVRRSRTAAAWGELGMTFYIHEFYVQASMCFRQAEKLQPDDPHWPYFQSLGVGPERSIGKLRRTAELCDNTPDVARLRLADALLAQDQTAEAAEQFARILKKDPENSRANLGMARLAHQRGEMEKSLQHLASPIQDRRTQKAAYLLLAQVHRARNETDAAEQAFRKANTLPKDQPWPDPFKDEAATFQTGVKAMVKRANGFLRKDRIADAISLLKETVRDYPDSHTALLLLGKAYVQQEDFAAAESALGEVLRSRRTRLKAQFRLGVALFRQNRTREASASFRRAIELQAGFGEAYFDLGHCLLKEGDRPAAIAAFRSAIDASPDFAAARRILGAQLAESGQTADAIEQFQAALKLDPDDRKAQELLELALKRKHN